MASGKVIHNLGQTRNAELGTRSDNGERRRTNGNRPGTTMLSQRRESMAPRIGVSGKLLRGRRVAVAAHPEVLQVQFHFRPAGVG